MAGRVIIGAIDRILLHTIGITSTTLLIDAVMSDYDPNATNVIPFPGSNKKGCPAPGPDDEGPEDPCDKVRNALDKLWNQLQGKWINPQNPEYPNLLKAMKEFNDSVDWYNHICHQQKGEPKYERRFRFVDLR